MTDKEKIREAFDKINIKQFELAINPYWQLYRLGYKSRDPEVKELEERIKIHIGVISDCEGLSGAQQKKIDGLSNQNKLLRDALENVKAIQPLYWNMTSDNMHPEHKFALAMAGIKEACKIAQEALSKTGGNDESS